MHRLLKTLWSNIVEDTKRLAKSHCLILIIAKSSEVANVLE
ncbi:hypothetical protein T06_16134 [Trichinella sp. T6]|nr:hypothetical protein T06_16134 [Trichinella sp. T6]